MPKWLVARCDPPEGESQLELCYKPGESGSLRRPLSLDQQLFVIDQQRRNKHLTALSLSGNGLGPFAASELAHVLTHVNLTLRQLDLSCNLLADAGAAHVAAMLRSNDKLTALDLYSNAIGDEGGGALLYSPGSHRRYFASPETGTPFVKPSQCACQPRWPSESVCLAHRGRRVSAQRGD